MSEPEELLAGKDGEPFTFRTPLGWHMFGLGQFHTLQSSYCTRCRNLLLNDFLLSEFIK